MADAPLPTAEITGATPTPPAQMVPPAIPLTAEQQARVVWLKNLQATSAGDDFINDIIAVIKKHVSKTNIERQMALAAQVVGQLSPLVDPKKQMTAYEADAVIRANIQRGRQKTMERIAKVTNL